MLKVEGVISTFFQLIFEVSSKLILNAINKNLEVSKVFLEESFEVRLYNKSDIFVAVFMLNL